jgi:hypothetical protein
MLVQWRASALLFNTTGYYLPRYYCIRDLRVPYNTIGSYIRDLEGAQPHCPSLGPPPTYVGTYVEGKEIPDLSTQQQSTESILVNSECLLFVDLCYGF